MKYTELGSLRKKLYFTVEDVAAALSLKIPSARVTCSRYTKQGVLIRLKKNFYVLDEEWRHFATGEYLKIANVLQVPSYISFMTALSFYEITTQVQRDFFESASLKRSARFEIGGRTFHFYKLQRRYYFGFERRDGIFMATKEKAFLDCIYLYSFGKYRIDFNSIDFKKLDRRRLLAMAKSFPRKTRAILEKKCRI